MRREVLQLQEPMMRVRAEQFHLLQTAQCFVPEVRVLPIHLHMAGRSRKMQSGTQDSCVCVSVTGNLGRKTQGRDLPDRALISFENYLLQRPV